MTLYWMAFGMYYILHLTVCFLEKETFRKITKVFAVPFLAASLVFTRTYNPLLFLGLFLGWVGDVFLICTGRKRYFVLGACSFILGHFCYIAATLGLFLGDHTLREISGVLWVLYGLIVLVLMTVAHKKVSRQLGGLAYLGAVYFSVLVGALFVSIAAGNYILTAAFGVFVVSDTILSICRFARKVKREHFYVMSTYILAQTLICISFIYG